MGQANFVHRLGGRLHFRLHGSVVICSGKNRCAKCERQRHARASERPTTHPAGSRCSCHASIVRLFPPADKDKMRPCGLFFPKKVLESDAIQPLLGFLAASSTCGD